MTLSKESADAFRQCLRILAPRCTPEERRVQSRNVESYIAEGKWIPALLIEDIALLFYPNDSSLESAMLIKMKAAIETQELISTHMKKDVLMASDLAAWPNCPFVPNNSPLRYWLPDWMHARAQSAAETASVGLAKTQSNKSEKTLIFEAKVLELLGKFWNDRKPGTEPTKTELCGLVYAEILRTDIRGERKTTQSMVTDAAKSWRVPLVLPGFVADSKFNDKRHPFKGDK